MNYFKKLHSFLDKEYSSRLIWLVFFSIFISIVETLGISAIMPFIDIATNFNQIHENRFYQQLFVFLGFESDLNFAIFLGCCLLGFYIFRGVVNLFYHYSMAHYGQNLYAHITKKLFRAYLEMPYQVFIYKNSSYLNKVIISEASLIAGVINAVLLMISEVFIIFFLYSVMLMASWKITLLFTFILLIKLFLLTKKVSNKLKIAGVEREKAQASMYEATNRLFGNFKQIKLQSKDRLMKLTSDFSKTVQRYSKANTKRIFLGSVPRLFLETGGFSLVVIFITFSLFSTKSDVANILPVLSLFVLALYRLLPSTNRIISSYNTLIYYYKSIDAVDDALLIKRESLDDKTLEFRRKIELNDINFSYQEKPVLKNVNLEIRKGEKIAIIGESGTGKTTLADLIIGLYQPNHGEMKVDEVLIDETNLQNWRSQVGYIPQHIYLFDGTIKDNVSFGRKFDGNLLDRVLKQANIYDFLQTKKGIETLVGEGGIQLSGGQKQRIAIARALYGEPEILVLDEATSALDNDTEEKIMEEIFNISEDKTLIIIAHRLSTTKKCDKIYKVKNKNIELQF